MILITTKSSFCKMCISISCAKFNKNTKTFFVVYLIFFSAASKKLSGIISFLISYINCLKRNNHDYYQKNLYNNNLIYTLIFVAVFLSLLEKVYKMKYIFLNCFDISETFCEFIILVNNNKMKTFSHLKKNANVKKAFE